MGMISAVKSLLKKTGMFPMAQNLYCALGGVVYRTESEWLHHTFGRRKDVFFIQVGAHDGRSNDSIYPFAREIGWSGILIEPVSYLFDRLVDNYRGASGITFENAALAEHDGGKYFYRLQETTDALPSWYDKIGSLNLETIRSHRSLIPDIDKYILQEEVKSVTFDTLVALHQVVNIDLILINTEGYDLNILKMFDLRRFRPKLVIYEQQLLSPADRAAAHFLLRSYGYIVHPIGMNNAATRTAILHRRRKAERTHDHHSMPDRV
jgi:FkbM family methyltransferase